MDKPIIFYGAGADASKANNLLKKYNPVCFVDSDTSKYLNLFMGRKVIDLKKALYEYPEALFYITTSKYKFEVMAELMKHVDAERIINYEPFSERLGCVKLEQNTGLGYSNGRFCISFCCPCPGHEKTPSIVLHTDNYEEFVSAYKSGLNNLISTLGEASHICEGCPSLTHGFYSDKKIIGNLGCTLPAACNAKCFYCNNPLIIRHNLSEKEIDKIDNFDYLAYIKAFEKHGLLDDSTVYSWAAGEITISKQKERIFDFAKNHTVNIMSNGMLLDNLLLEWISSTSANGGLNVSLDCGTAETFKRIKGIDAFKRTCDNLKKYGENRAKYLELKFILCEGYNDNEPDIDGFFEIARKSNVTNVVFERNFFDTQKPLTANMLTSAARFYNNALKYDVPLHIGDSFSIEQMSQMKNMEEVSSNA